MSPDWLWRSDPLYCAWSDAHETAELAWRTWRESPGEAAYLSFRAAADREDAAQDAMARVGSRRG